MDDTQLLLPFSSLPPLTKDEHDDACFRGKDLAWSCLAGFYDDRAAIDCTLNYQALGDRIGRSRAQVQRWIDSPHNMTLRSLALLAEGLDANLIIGLRERVHGELTNVCHPADAAKSSLPIVAFKAWLRTSALLDNSNLVDNKDDALSYLNQAKLDDGSAGLRDDLLNTSWRADSNAALQLAS